MTTKEWTPVSKAKPCPSCGKTDWCAWSTKGYLKCERSIEPPPEMVRVSMRDGGAVFGPERNGHTPPRKRKAPATLQRKGGQSNKTLYESGMLALAACDKMLGGEPANQWEYHGADGEPVGLVARWETPDGKTIRPFARTAAGWALGAMPEPRPLYRLPDLLAAPAGSTVYVLEGEKAADAAAACGLLATTSAGGSSAAAKTDWSPLGGRDVVVVPDHDDPGEHYASEVVRLATAAGARSVRVVRLAERWPDLPKGADLADLVAGTGGDAGAIAELAHEVESLAAAIEPEQPDEPEAPGGGAFEPFPTGVLPEPVRGFVVEAAKAIGCDETYVALPMLSALAAAIGNTHRIELKRGWLEPAIVWAAIVGESGTMKTPAFKAAMRTTHNAQNKAFAEHADALKEHETAQLTYEAELTAWKRKAGKGEGGDPPEKPTPPTARRYVVSDTTVEALAPILLGNPRGVLLARDELAGWVGSFDRYAGGKGADSANWLSFHNGETVTVDRKTGTPPTIHVPSASVSIAGGIQPGILARALSQEHHESGLLARVLFAMPPRKPKRWTEAEVSKSAEAAIEAVFAWLFALSPDTDDDGDETPHLLRLSADGKREWVAFYGEHAIEQAELTGDLAAAWSKLEGYAARLALVVHMVRWVAKDPTLGESDRVDEVSVQAGVAMARWFGGEARRVYAVLGEDDDDRETRQLVEWVASKGGTVTARDLTRGPRQYRGDPERAAKTLGDLVAAGLAVWVHDDHNPNGGRPTDRVRLA